MNYLIKYWEDNKKQILWSLISVFVLGMLAHAYCFFDNNFSHDSLYGMDANFYSRNHKIEIGRVFVPVYQFLFRGPVTLPWMVGFLTLLWIAVAVYFVVKLFEIKNPVALILTAGIFTVNLSVSATAATYMHDLDEYMFALMCSTFAAYLWCGKDFTKPQKWFAFPVAAVALTVSLGLYQGYVFVFAGLVTMYAILSLVEGKKLGEVVFSGLKAIACLLVAGVVYYVAMRWIQNITGVELAVNKEFNTLDKPLQMSPGDLPMYLLRSYRNWYTQLAFQASHYPGMVIKAMHKLMLLLWLGLVLLGLYAGKVKKGEAGLCLLLCALFPLICNFMYVLLLGDVHVLTSYPVWLFYLLLLLLLETVGPMLKKDRGLFDWGKLLCSVMVLFLIFSNIQFANAMYLKKDIEHDAYVSAMTRVVDRMEQMEGYEAGKTPVAFVGTFLKTGYLRQPIEGLEDYASMTGMSTPDLIIVSVIERYQAFFDNVMGISINYAGWDKWLPIIQSAEVKAMPCFPDRGCTAWVDDVLVVKMGNMDFTWE